MTISFGAIRSSRFLRLGGYALAGLLVAYAFAGFFLVPWIARRELPRVLDEQLHLKARVGAISFNPISLTLRLSDFALEDREGHPLLGFKEGTVDLEWRSLPRFAVVLGEVSLASPVVHVVIDKDGRVNLAALAGPPSAPAKESAPSPSRPPRVVIEYAAIKDGLVEFEDRRQGYSNRIEQLSVELESLSTFDADKGPYTVSARTPGGASLRWKGDVSLQPLAGSGTLRIENLPLADANAYLRDVLAARIASGRLDLELPYRFTAERGGPNLVLDNAGLDVRGFALAPPEGGKPLAGFEKLALEGVAFDLRKRKAAARKLRLAGLVVAAQLDAKGRLNLARIARSDKAAGPAKAESPGAAAPAWQTELGAVDITQANLSFADQASGFEGGIENLAAKISGISSDLAKPVVFELASSFRGGGRIAASGRATPADGALDAHVEGARMSLRSLQAFLPRTGVKLVSADLSLAGDLKLRGKSPKVKYSGNVFLSNVAVVDAAGESLFGWKSFGTDALRLTVSPGSAEIDELRLIAPEAKLVIANDRTSNIGRAFRTKDAAAPAPAAVPAENPAVPAPAAPPVQTPAAPAPAAGSRTDDAFAVSVRRVSVERGRMDFTDQSLSPNFTANIAELAGTANGLSSDRSTRSQFRLEGRIDQYGFARLSGTLNPFAFRDRSDFRVELSNLDVTTASPYTMKFAGYRIASGRLSLDLSYRVRGSRLEGDNKISLDQFTLGEKVDGSILNLPLDLAVAILKDPFGKIDVAVPVSGDLDDPQFDYGEVVGKALSGTVSGIVSAPFKALAGLFGGTNAEETGTIRFEPGSSRLLPPEREKLTHVADALVKRPQLKLNIPALYDAEADARALKGAALRRDIARRVGFKVDDNDSGGPINVDDKATRDALRELFTQRFSPAEINKLKAEAEAKAAAAGAAPAAGRAFASDEPRVADTGDFYRALVRGLREAQPLAPDALTGLGQKRAAAIAAALVQAGTDPARMTQLAVEPVANAEAKEIGVPLSFATGK
jgi:Domain of Unknown Function (DUF748)